MARREPSRKRPHRLRPWSWADTLEAGGFLAELDGALCGDGFARVGLVKRAERRDGRVVFRLRWKSPDFTIALAIEGAP